MHPSEEAPDRLTRGTALARKALALYGIRGAGLKLLSQSENTTFLVTDEDGARSVLRINRAGYHSEAALRAEITWLDALRREGTVRTAAPLPGRDGCFVQRIPGLPGEPTEEAAHCVRFEFLSGRAPRETRDALVGEFEKLGGITARLHNQVKGWRGSRGLPRPQIDFVHTLGAAGMWGSWTDGLGMTPELRGLFSAAVRVIERRLEAYGQGPERYGLIHADLRLANLLVDGEGIRVIDFDDCGYGWFMYDLAAALSFIEHEPYAPELIESWLRGYGRTGRLTPADAAEIPTFVMLRRILLVAWLGSHADTEAAGRLGAGYTLETAGLIEGFLRRRG